MDHHLSPVPTFRVKKISLTGQSDNEEDAHYIMHKLNEDRLKSNCFCDFLIKTSSQDFPVHKCVLGVMSDFFKKMFMSNMKEKYGDVAILENVNAETIELILDFIYGNDVQLNMANAYHLLEAADYLQIPLFQKRCIQFLVQHLSQDTVWKTWQYAKQYNSNNFLQDCECYIARNFAAFVDQKRHLDLDFDTFENFIRMQGSSGMSGKIIFQSIVEWIDYDKPSRGESFKKLFNLIDLQAVPKSYLNTVISSHELVLESHECSKKVLQSMRSILSAESTTSTKTSYSENSSSQGNSPRQFSAESNISPKASTSRASKEMSAKVTQISASQSSSHSLSDLLEQSLKSLTLQNQLFDKVEFLLVGGESSPRSFRKYNVVSKSWSHTPDFADRDCIGIGLARVNTVLYTIGGRESFSMNATDEVNSILTKNLMHSDSWRDRDELNDKRFNFGCTTLKNQIFVAGGLAHKTKWLSSVESYNFRKDSWACRPDMNYRRAGCGLVECGGILYVVGGSQSTKVFHDSIEMFEDDYWEVGPSMQVARSNLATVVLNNEIYAIGGMSDPSYYCATVEVFNCTVRRWRSCRKLHIPRAGHCACVVKGKIYVAGGSNHKGPVKHMEMFDPATNSWAIVGNIKGDPVGVAMIAI